LNLTLKVISCAPRVFEIRNFLSELEIDHILTVAKEKELKDSTTRAGSHAKAMAHKSSRTSTNTWIGRHQSIILDAVYRRAADVMQIDEKFFRYRRPLEIPEMHDSKVGIAEDLQLVHYDVGQQYVSYGCHCFGWGIIVCSISSTQQRLLHYFPFSSTTI
jgi:prolyl 4-hydroxylase